MYMYIVLFPCRLSPSFYCFQYEKPGNEAGAWTIYQPSIKHACMYEVNTPQKSGNFFVLAHTTCVVGETVPEHYRFWNL